jgi:hypothetical protein
MDGIIINKDKIPVLPDALENLKHYFTGENLENAATYVQNNKHNQVTSTYYLLLKKKERQTGKNYLFEQVTFEKRKQLYSTNNIHSKDSELPAHPHKYSQSETRTKFDFKSSDELMSTHSSKFSPKVNHAKFGQTMKAQSVGRQSDDARTHFSHLANHKDSIKSDDHPTAFGISRHTIKQRTSPLPQNTLYHFSDHNTIK